MTSTQLGEEYPNSHSPRSTRYPKMATRRSPRTKNSRWYRSHSPRN
ncbi:MAG: hypothetical protein SWX82_17535 [Cyanobacteriota bacterium]|nr:hypothetical protein [Cyanobacteriota bacterium]